jgi:hypothetical protein
MDEEESSYSNSGSSHQGRALRCNVHGFESWEALHFYDLATARFIVCRERSQKMSCKQDSQERAHTMRKSSNIYIND